MLKTILPSLPRAVIHGECIGLEGKEMCLWKSALGLQAFSGRRLNSLYAAQNGAFSVQRMDDDIKSIALTSELNRDRHFQVVDCFVESVDRLRTSRLTPPDGQRAHHQRMMPARRLIAIRSHLIKRPASDLS